MLYTNSLRLLTSDSWIYNMVWFRNLIRQRQISISLKSLVRLTLWGPQDLVVFKKFRAVVLNVLRIRLETTRVQANIIIVTYMNKLRMPLNSHRLFIDTSIAPGESDRCGGAYWLPATNNIR